MYSLIFLLLTKGNISSIDTNKVIVMMEIEIKLNNIFRVVIFMIHMLKVKLHMNTLVVQYG